MTINVGSRTQRQGLCLFYTEGLGAIQQFEYCKALYVRDFACPLFREFCELNNTAKLKGVNIDTVPTLISITHVLKLCGLHSPK